MLYKGTFLKAVIKLKLIRYFYVDKCKHTFDPNFESEDSSGSKSRNLSFVSCLRLQMEYTTRTIALQLFAANIVPNQMSVTRVNLVQYQDDSLNDKELCKILLKVFVTKYAHYQAGGGELFILYITYQKYPNIIITYNLL